MLPDYQVRLSIATAIVDGISVAPLEHIVDRLCLEDPAKVISIYGDITEQRQDLRNGVSGRGWRKEEEYKDTATKLETVTRHRPGMTIADIVSYSSMPRAVLVSLLEHHGYLELAYCGGKQRRMMVTDAAFKADYGHNVYPTNRIGHLEGFNVAAVFPVFYQEVVDNILWTLDYRGVKDTVLGLASKKKRVQWLLQHHRYLPDQEIANLAGYSRRGVIKARNKARGLPPLHLPKAA